ncbi:MAG: hypothetical protein IJZ84_04710 [Lachnospiraceae bacterium]|nr:hypothetical protein [Lachnospiraceae bacterium]
MDVKELVEKLVDKIKDSDSLKEQFDKEPVKVIEKFLGVDLPDEIVEKVIDGVKAKITLDKVSDVAGALKGLFGKK